MPTSPSLPPGSRHLPSAAEAAELSVPELLVLLARMQRQARLRALEPYGLAVHQGRAFTVIAHHADADRELRLSELAQRLHIAPRSATEVVDGLQERGLVRRSRSTSDRRAIAVQLTDEGRRLQQRLSAELDSRAALPGLAALTDDQQRTLRELLATVAAAQLAD